MNPIRLGAFLCSLACLCGCSLLGELVDGGSPPVVAQLEVFNRTEDAIYLIAADGERLDVPACGRAMDESFRIDEVRVRAQGGYIRGFGAGDTALAGRHVVLVELARADLSGMPMLPPPPDPLPPCQGHPQVQPGV